MAAHQTTINLAEPNARERLQMALSLRPQPDISPADSEEISSADPETEKRMRAALGVGDQPRTFNDLPRTYVPRRQHRFVRDGEVQVARVSLLDGANSSTLNRRAILESQLVVERERSSELIKQLNQSKLLNQQYRTRIGHLELSCREMTQARDLLALQLRSILESQERRETSAETTRAPTEEVAPPARKSTSRSAGPATIEKTKAAAETKPPPRHDAPKKPRKVREPQPVKWWLPSFKAKRK